MGIMTGSYRYIVANLDFHTMDLEPYQHGDTNITGVRLVSPDEELVLQVAKSIYEVDEPYLNGLRTFNYAMHRFSS